MDQWDRKMAEINATLDRIAKRQEEADKRQEKADKWRAEADKRFAKMRKESRKELSELAAQMKETRATLSGIGISNGMVAEELVYRALKKKMTFGGEKFTRASRPVHEVITLPGGERIEGEFDVGLFNGTSAVIIDVKYRVRKEDLDYLVDVQMPKFKVVLPQYKDCKMYLGIGGMAFEEGVEEEALRRGIGVLRLNDDFVEIRDKKVKAW